MESAVPFVAALGLIALLELGDKTQLVTISLATRHPWRDVLAGAVTGLVAATAIGAAIGGVLAATLGGWLTYIKIGGGILFIFIGVWTVVQAVRHRHTDETEAVREKRSAFATSASFNFLAEFGDKTQIAVIILAASYAAPLSVFLGGSAGLSLIAVSSVAIGRGLARILSEKWLRLVSTALFILAGVLLIVEAFFEL